MDMNTTLLALASDARLASVPVCDVLNALNLTTSTGLVGFIKGCRIAAIQNMNVLCNIDDVYIINGKRLVIGNPCYVGATGRLNIWQDTIVVAKADKAIAAEIIGDDAIKYAIYRD